MDHALRVVDRAHFCLDAEGRPLPQTSAPEMVARMLRLLDVQPGNHVLEIGTGSGYSTALLAELVGPTGSVVSIDVDLDMTQRAARLLAEAGYHNIVLVTADGRSGYRSHAPFDRLIAWAAAASLVPQAWCDQTRPGATLVVPVRHNQETWVSKYHRTADGTLHEGDRIPGSFSPRTP